MKTFGMTCAAIAAVVLGLATGLASGAEPAAEKAPEAKLRIGTFDSRALAVVYYNSAAFESQMAGLKAEYEKAKAAGDEKRVKEPMAKAFNPSPETLKVAMDVMKHQPAPVEQLTGHD